MRDLIILRTHKFDQRVQDCLRRYAEVRGADVVLGVDERAGEVDCGPARKVPITDETLDRLGLYRHPKSGWQCGDYVYYAVRAALPGYRSYWMLEPDVEVHFRDINGFFDAFADVPDDFLAANFGPRERRSDGAVTAENTGWATLVGQHARPYGCLFPVTRLSGRAIDYLARRRAEAHPKDDPQGRENWPNDEVFVCTEAMAGGFLCSDLNDHGRQVYDLKNGFSSWRRRSGLYLLGVPEHFTEGMVYHPVFGVDEYVDALVKDYRAHTGDFVKYSGMLGSTFSTARLLDILDEEVGRAAVRSARQVAKAAATRPEQMEDVVMLGLRGAVVQEERRPMQAFLRRTVPAAGVGPLVHQCMLARNRGGELGLASPEGFGLGPEIELDYFPRHRATAHCLDLARREVVFTCCYDGPRLFAQPPLPVAQHDQASHVVRVPYERVGALYGPTPAEEAPTIVLSIGSCGAAVAGFLRDVRGTLTVSGPDVFSQIHALLPKAPGPRKRVQAASPEEARAVLLATVRSLAGYAGVEELALELRPAANRGIEAIADAFPGARFIMVLRQAEAWARCQVVTSNRKPLQLVEILQHGIAAYDTLRAAGLDCALVWHEDLLREPEAALAAVFRHVPALDDAQRAALVAAAGKGLAEGDALAPAARERQCAEDGRVESVVADFLQLWRDARPAALIERHGLPY